MRVTGISDLLTRMAKSKAGQKVYKSLLNPNKENFLNNTLPLVESAVCTGSYIYATATDKKIPKESKPALQWQNVINGVAGIAVSSKLNKWVSKKGATVIKDLDPKVIKDFEGVVNGVRVGLPILMTSLIMRYAVSTLSVPISVMAKKFDKFFTFNKDSKKQPGKVDIKA